MTPMMSEILPEDSSIRAMASTALATTRPLRSAMSRALVADAFACWAFAAFRLTVAEMSSSEADVCSRLAACSSVRCERSIALAEISVEALETSCVAFDNASIVSCSRVTVRLNSSLISS